MWSLIFNFLNDHMVTMEDIMPKQLFFELSDEKRRTIIFAGIKEFANYGYENSSTNRIVKEAGISKGSLFKYFSTKEDFYLYVLDVIANEMISDLQEKVNNLSNELFQRIIEYSTLEFSWYILNPEKSKIIVNAFSKTDTDISRKIEMRYGRKEQDIYYWLLQDVDTSLFRWNKKKTIEILKWFLKGFNNDFLQLSQEKNCNDFEELKKKYISNLSEYIEMLKKGLIK